MLNVVLRSVIMIFLGHILWGWRRFIDQTTCYRLVFVGIVTFLGHIHWMLERFIDKTTYYMLVYDVIVVFLGHIFWCLGGLWISLSVIGLSMIYDCDIPSSYI